MMKQLRRGILCLILMAGMFAMSGLPVRAASGKAVFNDPTVVQGEQVTVTMTVSADCALGAIDATLTYDNTLLEFVSGSGPAPAGVSGAAGGITLSWYEATTNETKSVTFTFVFKTLKTGSTTIKPSRLEVSNLDYEMIDLTSTGSSVITIAPPYQASTESRLSKLKVGSYELSPAFSPDITDYYITVGHDTTKLVISADIMDEKAIYYVENNDNIKVGDNIVKVVGRAEARNETVYKIHVYRPAPPETEPPTQPPTQPPTEPPTTEPPTTEPPTTEPPTTEPPTVLDPENNTLAVKIGDKTLFISKTMDGLEIPEGFETRSYTYGNQVVTAATGLAKPLTLMWLTDEHGENGAFYIYDAGSGQFCKMVNVPVNQKIYTILPVDNTLEIPDGFMETTITLKGETVRAWIAEKDQSTNFVLVYAMNWNGEKNLYRYDAVEGTLQRYVRENLGDSEVTLPDDGDNNGDDKPVVNPGNNNLIAELEARLEQMKKTYEAELERVNNNARILIAFCIVCIVIILGLLTCIKIIRDKAAAEEEARKEADKARATARKEAKKKRMAAEAEKAAAAKAAIEAAKAEAEAAKAKAREEELAKQAALAAAMAAQAETAAEEPAPEAAAEEPTVEVKAEEPVKEETKEVGEKMASALLMAELEEIERCFQGDEDMDILDLDADDDL